MSKSKRSELDRWAEVAEKASTIEEFIDWCATKGIFLEGERGRTPGPHKLCEEFFEIDANKLERERRALIESLQVQS